MSLQQVDKRAEDALAAATGPDVKAALTTEESEVQSLASGSSLILQVH